MITELEFKSLALEGYNRIPLMAEAFADLETPLSLYLKDGKVKVELAVAKGKKLYDKRHSIAERDAGREIERRMKETHR